MTDFKDISEQIVSQVDDGARVINLSEESSTNLFFNGEIDLRDRVLVFNPKQFIEFGSEVNLNGSAIFLNGADQFGLPQNQEFVLVRGRIPDVLIEFGFDGELRFNREVPPPIVGAFKRIHQDLFAERHGIELGVIDSVKSDSTSLERLFAECWFLIRNPSLPLENIGSSLENYDPKNDSQIAAKLAAQKLLSLPDPSRPAGLFLTGTPGIGKTHLSVALALEFMTQGWPTFFMSADRPSIPAEALKSRHPAAWILDDLNSPYGQGMSEFKKLIVHVHETGGRLFVTSNTDLEKLMASGFVTDESERPRIMDRFKGMMLALKVEGESNRTASPWYAE